MIMNLLQIEITLKSRFAPIQELLNQRRSHCVGLEAEVGNSENISSQFLQMQKNQLTELQEYIDRYRNTLTAFVFSSAR